MDRCRLVRHQSADHSQCAGVAVLCRYLPHRVPACPGLAPYVAKAKKGERGPIRFRMRAICSLEAKIDEARLVGMKCEPIPRKPLVQNTQNPLGVAEVRANAITASSANRTRVLLPSRRGRTSFSNHSSSTWCRKMFERQGEITPPCGEPSVAWRKSPSSRTPAFSHLSIIRRMTPSVNSSVEERPEGGSAESNSKYLTMSISSTQRRRGS